MIGKNVKSAFVVAAIALLVIGAAVAALWGWAFTAAFGWPR